LRGNEAAASDCHHAMKDANVFLPIGESYLIGPALNLRIMATLIRRPSAIPLVIYAVLAVSSIREVGGQGGQPPPADLLAKLDVYLTQYETDLSTIVAHENYRQSESRISSSSADQSLPSIISRQRTLYSEVAFWRLPGEREWFGVRHVRRIDGKDVDARGLVEVLSNARPDLDKVAREIVDASSRHNLGEHRTVNMPTVPLELLHPRNRAKVQLQVGRGVHLNGARTTQITYREIGEGGLIRDRAQRPMRSSGSVWVEPDGRIRRITLHLRMGRASTMSNELRVDYRFDTHVNAMVPTEMTEDFIADGGGEFKGRATYSNFRRFTTAARIVPQSQSFRHCCSAACAGHRAG
jgi:hypothetical protein